MWNKVPAVRLLFPFLTGIVIALHVVFPQVIITVFFWVSLIFLAAFFFLQKLAKSFRLHVFRGIVLQIVLLAGGIYLVQIRDPLHQKNYFGNAINRADVFKIKILTPPEEKAKTIKLTVSIESAFIGDEEEPTSGKSLVYIKKDSAKSQQFSYGDILYIKNEFQAPEEIKNPYEFDYKKYLANQGIHFTAFIQNEEYVKYDENEAKGFWKMIFSSRLHFENLIQEHIHNADAKSVSGALLLGVRSSISDDISQAYANTGTMHILSVSGLHVGILFFIIDWLLRFIPYFKVRKFKNKMVKAILITIIIWFYACITGLSPSVSRSAVMFTFLIFGRIDTKYTNSYNILASSALPLLFINPFMITQVGFQLSYLAILGIVTFQPKINKLYFPSTIIGKYIWSLGTVSIGAQLGTVPVTILYFHQFPNYFLLSNIIAIPISFVVLLAGILFFSLSFIQVINPFTGWILEFSMNVLNKSVVVVDKIPGALTDKLFITPWQTILFYIILIFLGIFIYSKQKQFLLYTLLATCILCTAVGVKKFYRYQQNEIMAYELPKDIALCTTHGNQATIFSANLLSDTSADFTFHIENDLLSKCIKSFHFKQLPGSKIALENVFMIDTNLFLSLHKNFELPKDTLPQIDYVIVMNSPFFEIEETAKIFPQAKFIFSPSNSYKSLNYWTDVCEEKNISFHNMKDDGYTILTK
ncbi:MAG: ComEC/Rec2 family competence protein [Chitinophagales bacterium]